MGLLLNLRVWAVLAALVFLAFTHFSAYRAGRAVIRAEWTAQRLEDSQRHAEELEAALAAQRALQARIDQIMKDNRHEIARINRAHTAALDGLRQRPEARSDAVMPTPAGATAGCTGAGLARPDAEFLVGFAADAARLQSALNECRSRYQAARESLGQ